MTDTIEQLRNLLQQARDLIDDPSYWTDLVKKIDDALKQPAHIINVTLQDAVEEGKTIPARIDIEGGAIGIWLEGHGTGACAEGKGLPVVIELYEGDVRTLVWSDINQEDPTCDIHMDGAREDRRAKE